MRTTCLLLALLALPAVAQDPSTGRSIRVQVADGRFVAEVDGVPHTFETAEQLDRFLTDHGLGRASFRRGAALPGLPGLPKLPKLPTVKPGSKGRSVQVEVGGGRFRATVDGKVHDFPTALALDAFLRANGLGSASSGKGPRPVAPPAADEDEDERVS